MREEPPQEEPQAPAMQGYQPQEMPQYQAWEATHMVTTLEVEVVDMTTTQDISLTASLGSTSLPIISLFYITLILFRFLSFKLQKPKKILFVLLSYLLLVICFMLLKTKKNKNIFFS